MNGKVYFLGAGPGDPDLLTRKAWKILTAADVVLHDALVAPEIVRLAPPAALVRDVGKRCGSKSITQQQIHDLLVRHASAGRVVVRLQGGDPLIFGRAGEEIEALRNAGIEFELVPGVTAASAAAAAAQVALTDRRIASKLILLSGHRRSAGVSPLRESLSAPDATLAIYMPGADYQRIAADLSAAGLDPETPCLIVSQASKEGQTVLRADLASLARIPALPAPSILLVGQVAQSSLPGTLVPCSAASEI